MKEKSTEVKKNLTLEILDALPPGEIFRTGTFLDTAQPGDGNIALCFPISNKEVRWIAIKGKCTKSDWAILCENPHYKGSEYEFIDLECIKARGNKLTHPNNIKKLVPCTNEVFDRYRY